MLQSTWVPSRGREEQRQNTASSKSVPTRDVGYMSDANARSFSNAIAKLHSYLMKDRALYRGGSSHGSYDKETCTCTSRTTVR